MSNATYGELVAAGERAVVEAALQSRAILPNAPAAIAMVRGHEKLVKALRANLRLFTRLPSVDNEPRERSLSEATVELAAALDALIDRAATLQLPHTSARWETNTWSTAARTLHAAADALETHLGPERAHRTADATSIDAPEAGQAVIRRLAEITLTVGVAQHRLALRVHEIAAGRPRLRGLDAAATQMFGGHDRITAAASGVITAQTRTPIPERLASLAAAPLLFPTRTRDPITAARQSFDRIRVIAHRQSRGELPAGIDAIRSYATVASLVSIHAHAIFAAAGSAERLGNRVDRQQAIATASVLSGAAHRWDAVAVATERFATTRHSPRLLSHETAVLATSFAALTRHRDRWRTPDELLPDPRTANRLVNIATHAISRLPELAQASVAITSRLSASGDLLVPTRDREDIDWPYRWAPAGSQQLNDLRAAVNPVVTDSRDLVERHRRGPGACLTNMHRKPDTPIRLESAQPNSALIQRC